MPTCPGCSAKMGGESLLGALGSRKHYRCRWCGMGSSQDASRRPPKRKAQPKAKPTPEAPKPSNESAYDRGGRVVLVTSLSEEDGPTKQFIMAARSTRRNAFGHEGHVWVARDGHVIQGLWSPYQNSGKIGPTVNTMASFPLTAHGRVAHGRHLGYEHVSDVGQSMETARLTWQHAEEMQARGHLDRLNRKPYRPSGLGESTPPGKEDPSGAPNIVDWTRRLKKVGEPGALSSGREVAQFTERFARRLRESTWQRYAARFGTFARSGYGDRVVMGHDNHAATKGRSFIGTGEVRIAKPGDFHVDPSGPLPRAVYAREATPSPVHIVRPLGGRVSEEASYQGADEFKGWMLPNGSIHRVARGKEHAHSLPRGYEHVDRGRGFVDTMNRAHKEGLIRFGKFRSSIHGPELFIHYDGGHPQGHRNALRLLGMLKPDPHEHVTVSRQAGLHYDRYFGVDFHDGSHVSGPANEIRRDLMNRVRHREEFENRNPGVAMKARFFGRPSYSTDAGTSTNKEIRQERQAMRGTIRKWGVAARKDNQDRNADLWLRPTVQKRMANRARREARARAKVAGASPVRNRTKSVRESTAKYIRKTNAIMNRWHAMRSDAFKAKALRHANAGFKERMAADYAKAVAPEVNRLNAIRSSKLALGSIRARRRYQGFSDAG